MKNKILSLFVLALLGGAGTSCTDLSDVVYSEITEEDFVSDSRSLDILLGQVYAKLGAPIADCAHWFNESTADCMLIPYRNVSNEWGGAMHVEKYTHTWNAKTGGLKQLWDAHFSIVTTVNLILPQIALSSLDEETKLQYDAELRMVRAYVYYNILDYWGDAPLIVSNEVDMSEVTKSSSAEIYNFMMSEFKDCLPHLSKDVKNMYGRMHYYAALAIKARYLINANVFLDTERNDKVYPYESEGLDDCIAVCNEIIKDGGYDLEPDYFTNFKADNESLIENIFVIPFHQTYSMGVFGNVTSGFNLGQYCLQNSQQVFFGGNVGNLWNGYCALPSMYKSFDEKDLRRNGWNVGLQTYNGEPLYCQKAGSNGAELNFTVDWDIENCHEYDGARLVKYEFPNDFIAYSIGNDFPVIRYADILLMKAEAIMRKNNWVATSEAVDLVNEVRNRSFENSASKDYYTTSNLTKEELLEERRREFYGELIRRTDLIRFHEFIGGDWEPLGRPSSSYTEYFRTVFPIPQGYLYVAPKVEQNYGY